MEVAVRPLHERDLAEADRIFRLAFGTFLGLPDPTAFAGDSDHVRSRWTADPEATFGAEAGGELVGSNLVTCCHSGKGSEAGSGTTFVKFGVVRPGPQAADTFDVLLTACDALARALGTTSLVAGVNLGREAAYRRMLVRGFRTVLQGVAMHRPNEPGYCRPEVFLIDDWR